jgi:hypothetical protein
MMVVAGPVIGKKDEPIAELLGMLMESLASLSLRWIVSQPALLDTLSSLIGKSCRSVAPTAMHRQSDSLQQSEMELLMEMSYHVPSASAEKELMNVWHPLPCTASPSPCTVNLRPWG